MKHRQLAELMNIQSGYAFKSQEYTNSGHFLVRIGNVQDGYVSLDNPKYVALDDLKKSLLHQAFSGEL